MKTPAQCTSARRPRLCVVAIGGNSLIQGDRSSVEDQYRAVCTTVQYIADIIRQGWQVVITHGNGPQVGFIMLRAEIARAVAGMHSVPLVSCVADTQGAIGYQIQQALENELASDGLKPRTVTVVTQVLVSADDPGFQNPDKFVGEFYKEEQLADLRTQHSDWILKKDSNRGWRRVVPSPLPLEIVELDAIATLLEKDFHVIAAGGGGIPVVQTPYGMRGIDAVIDKDLSTRLLATGLGAELLIISTGVEQLALFFGTPQEQKLGTVHAPELAEYLKQGHFPPGSMEPKVQASLDFLAHGGKEVIITNPENLDAALRHGKGTHIVP